MESQEAFDKRQISELKVGLVQTIKKVNYHYTSGYSDRDPRGPQSIFLNFFKKEIRCNFLHLIRSHHVNIGLNSNKKVEWVIFDCYDKNYQAFLNFVQNLNQAARDIDYNLPAKEYITCDRMFSVAARDLEKLKNFKFK